MKRKFLLALLVFIILVGALCMVMLVQKNQARKALAAYKAELRAKGEALTYEDIGYPFPMETNANLEELEAISVLPGYLDYTALATTGRLALMWQQNKPATISGRSFTWEELQTDCLKAAEVLQALRVELENPPRRFGWNYTNPFAQGPRPPFVHQRKVAQFISGDAMAALRSDNLPVVQADLRALTQMTQVYRDDYSLLSAMIRVAISSLALDVTRQALPMTGWGEERLRRLQADWEGVDLPAALERAFVGERVFGLEAFEKMRQGDPSARRILASGIAGLVYRGVMDSDELFYLQQLQRPIQLARRLQAEEDAFSLLEADQPAQINLAAQTGSLLWRYKHLLSAIALPNFNRAFETMLRAETERRLTITVIALKRFQLAHQRHPQSLAELVPQFLSAELTDPWSGKAFHYRLKGDGSFTLYSVGADGHDDGGDPASSGTTGGSSGMWIGKDAVWPITLPQKPAVDN